MRRILSVFVVVACGVPGFALAQQPSPKAFASDLERAAKQTWSIEQFGQDIAKGLLLAAAEEFRKGAVNDGTAHVNLSFTVRPAPPLPGVPTPGNVNMCWETCSSASCLWTCPSIVPDLGISPGAVSQTATCTDLWERYWNAIQQGQRAGVWLLQLVANDCLQLGEVSAALTKTKK